MSWENLLKLDKPEPKDFGDELLARYQPDPAYMDVDSRMADVDRENFDMIDPNTGIPSKENVLRLVGIVDKPSNKLVELENMMQEEQPYDFYETNEIKQLSNILSKAIVLLESAPLRR